MDRNLGRLQEAPPNTSPSSPHWIKPYMQLKSKILWVCKYVIYLYTSCILYLAMHPRVHVSVTLSMYSQHTNSNNNKAQSMHVIVQP